MTPSRKNQAMESRRQLWKATREFILHRGYDLKLVIPTWVDGQRELLRSMEGQEGFAELSELGCKPHMLLAILALLRHAPRLESTWKLAVEPPLIRERMAKRMDAAASAVEKMFLISPDDEPKDWKHVEKLGHIPPYRIVSELRFYSQMMRFIGTFTKDIGAHSLTEVSKYLLADYVYRTTGRFRDRACSALVADVVRAPKYDEVIHRMWRNRNYRRLNRSLSGMSKFINGLGDAVDLGA